MHSKVPGGGEIYNLRPLTLLLVIYNTLQIHKHSFDDKDLTYFCMCVWELRGRYLLVPQSTPAPGPLNIYLPLMKWDHVLTKQMYESNWGVLDHTLYH